MEALTLVFVVLEEVVVEEVVVEEDLLETGRSAPQTPNAGMAVAAIVTQTMEG
jgi:hypothetical protein